MPKWIIFTNRGKAQSFLARCDGPLHYPESLDSLRWVGVGIHCDKEIGRAHHYAVEMADKNNGRWALPYTAAVDPTQDQGTAVDDLPSDWFPTFP